MRLLKCLKRISKWKKNTLKSCSEFLKSTFSLTALTAQTTQTEEFLFQKVAYWLTVYRTGVCSVHGVVERHLDGCHQLTHSTVGTFFPIISNSISVIKMWKTALKSVFVLWKASLGLDWKNRATTHLKIVSASQIQVCRT